MSFWWRDFLAGAVLKLFAIGALGFVAGAVMMAVNGVQMLPWITDDARARRWGNSGRPGFPIFLPDDAFTSDEGRQFRDRAQRWVLFALLSWLGCVAMLAIRFYGLRCAGLDGCDPVH